MQAKTIIKYLFLYSILILSFLSANISRSAIFITDILYIILLLLLFQNKRKFTNTILIFNKPVVIIFLTLIILSLASSILNFVPPLATLWGIRTFYRFAIFFLACITFLDIQDCVYYEKWLPKLLIVNFVFSGIQFFVLNKRGDSNHGLLSGNGDLYILCYISMTYYILAYLHKRINITSTGIYLSLVLLIALFAELKIIYILFPVIFGIGILITKPNKNTIFLFIFFIVFIMLGLKVISIYNGDEYTNKITDKDNLLEYSNKEGGYNFNEGGLNRGIALSRTDLLFYKDNTFQRYIGMGIGSASASSFINSPFFIRYGTQLSYQFFFTSYFLIENGWIGFILYLSIWVSLALRLKKIKNKNDNFLFWRSFGIVLLFQIIISIWYDTSLISNANCIIFIYLAIPFIINKEILLRAKVIQIIHHHNEKNTFSGS